MVWKVEDECQVENREGFFEVLAIMGEKALLKCSYDDSRCEAPLADLIRVHRPEDRVISQAWMHLRDDGFEDIDRDMLITLYNAGMLVMPVDQSEE